MTAQTVDTSKLWDMIKDIRFGMLTVRGADGRLYARPMTTQNGEADRGGVIWFFMSRSGQPMLPLTPGEPRQREIAFRAGANMVMYVLTGNYKADQVHVPALLERLGQ